MECRTEKDTLTVRFLAPEILFESGSDVLKPQFKDILSDFMPDILSC